VSAASVADPAIVQAPQRPPAWHATPAAEVCRVLGSDATLGLSLRDAAARRSRVGPNRIDPGDAPSLISRLAAPLRDIAVLVLFAAALLSALLGEWIDAIAIGLIITLNATVSIAQSWRADRALAALQARAALTAHVIRQGIAQPIAATELVPGDLLEIDAGQQLPADLRWIECASLQVDESALTGESVPVTKQCDPPLDADTPLAERSTLGFAGSHALSGRARAVVVATGMDTETGRIAALLKTVQRPQTPLQQRLKRLARRLAFGVVLLCVTLIVLGLLRHQPALPILMLAISLAVAAIPEALPAALTLLLSIGAHRLASSNALVRRLSAMEALGSVDVICSDKTGTLTANRMQAMAVWLDGKERPLDPDAARVRGEFWQALLLNNDAVLASNGPSGDPTEIALLQAGRSAGLAPESLREQWPRVAEHPFDSRRKCMSTLHRQGQRLWQITKGAPEMVLPKCIGESMRQQALKHAQTMAERGWRVLAIAERRPRTEVIQESDLTLLGLIALADPPRDGVHEALQECRSAGIRTLMITGDHPATARAIALTLGLCKDDAQVLTGAALDAMTDEQVRKALETVRVFARVSPEHKVRLVQALQAGGARVAMTGDGVNDAPALQRADIGVAMGRGGTDVARQAAALVLLDDHFATIVLAVREGRRIQANLQRFLTFALSGNAAEIIAIGLGSILGLPAALSPVHILWINLVTDGLPGLALAGERASPNLMRCPPHARLDEDFGPDFWRNIGLIGGIAGGATLALQAWAAMHHPVQATTMVFTALTLAQLMATLALRSDREALWQMTPWGNPALLSTVLVSLAIHAAIVHLPVLQSGFHTVGLDAHQWSLSALPALLVVMTIESLKGMRRHSAGAVVDS
jgi:Ca2+-transporting ATPase